MAKESKTAGELAALIEQCVDYPGFRCSVGPHAIYGWSIDSSIEPGAIRHAVDECMAKVREKFDLRVKTTMPVKQLCDLLLMQIQAVKGMETVSQVRIHPLTEGVLDNGANWSPAGFNPGRADIESVDLALRPIIKRFQQTVDIAND